MDTAYNAVTAVYSVFEKHEDQTLAEDSDLESQLESALKALRVLSSRFHNTYRK